MTRGEIITILTQVADAKGLPRQLMVACAYAESRLDSNARRPSDPSKYQLYWSPPDPFDVSGGLGQKIVRYMAAYLAWCDSAGHNPDDYPGDHIIDTMLDLLNDPVVASHQMANDLAPHWQRHQPDMAATLAEYNWPNGGGAFYTPAHEQNYREGITFAASVTGGIVSDPAPRVTFDATFPPTIQDDDWSCAPSSLDWALRALGRSPGHSYIENLLVHDGLVSTELGLLDASGAQLAAWIGKKVPADVYYGADGFYGNNEASVSFDAVAAEIGPYPLLIGGHNWGGAGLGHWSGVRGYDRNRGVLLLANPAGTSATFGGQEMTRQQFAQRGPYSMVRVLHPDIDGSTAPPITPSVPVASRADVLRSEIQARVDELVALASRQ
jgi:hypothetical protein